MDSRPRATWTTLLLGLCVTAPAVLAGCGGSGSTPGDDPSLSAAGPWAIAVDQFDGSGHQGRAEQRARQFAHQTGLSGFHAVDAGARSMVYFGRYTSPRSTEAQRDLGRLRQLQARGRFQPRSIIMGPMVQPVSSPSGTATNVSSAWDLARVDQEGAIYTLQVASFNSDFEGDRRSSAEQLAGEYRRAGNKAFYYHGPRESLVTIELFGHAAVELVQAGPDKGQTVYHPYIRDTLQAEYPHMHVNGEKVPIPGNPGEFVPTFLVRVPSAK